MTSLVIITMKTGCEYRVNLGVDHNKFWNSHLRLLMSQDFIDIDPGSHLGKERYFLRVSEIASIYIEPKGESS